MKNLSLGSAGTSDTRLSCHSRRFCTLGAVAGVLLSTMLASGALKDARAQDASLWKADTLLSTRTCVDLSSHDTITKLVRTIAYNDVRNSDWQKRLVENLTGWGRTLDAQAREDLLLGNLKMGTLPDAVFQAAETLGLPDSAMQRLRGFVSKSRRR